MLISYIVLIISTFFVMFVLSVVMENAIVAAILTIIIVMTGYIVFAYVRSKKIINLLEEDCDPHAFLVATEKQRKYQMNSPKYNALFSINKAAGLAVSGEFENAKEVLLIIDKKYLSTKNETLLVYTLNLISCLYELGEISDAEELFETQIPILAPLRRRTILAIKILIAERFLFLNRYEESKEKFEHLLSEKISKRARLSILHRLMKIDEQIGDKVSAKKKYEEISATGNKLWIAEDARRILERM